MIDGDCLIHNLNSFKKNQRQRQLSQILTHNLCLQRLRGRGEKRGGFGYGCEENSGSSWRCWSSKNSSEMGTPQPHSIWRFHYSSPCFPKFKIQEQEQNQASALERVQIGPVFQGHLRLLPQCKQNQNLDSKTRTFMCPCQLIQMYSCPFD